MDMIKNINEREDSNIENLTKNLNDKINLITKNFEDLKTIHEHTLNEIKKEKLNNEKIVETCRKYPAIDSDIVRLNVGGTLFSTLKSTLTKKITNSLTGNFYDMNLLEALANGYADAKFDENKALFIDRNPKYFSYILDYLRDANTEIEFELPSSLDLQEFKREVHYFNIQGLNEMINLKLDSKILTTNKQIKDLRVLCEFNFKDHWNLLYRGSRDGFQVNAFHSKCDNIPNTLTIVKSTNGNVFGGYTDMEWNQSDENWKSDANCFIFSLVNKDNKPIKLKSPSEKEIIIFCGAKYGPTFGERLDLSICDNSDSCQYGSSNLGYSFKHRTYEYESNEALTFLAGLRNFQVFEIEVFNINS